MELVLLQATGGRLIDFHRRYLKSKATPRVLGLKGSNNNFLSVRGHVSGWFRKLFTEIDIESEREADENV